MSSGAACAWLAAAGIWDWAGNAAAADVGLCQLPCCFSSCAPAQPGSRPAQLPLRRTALLPAAGRTTQTSRPSAAPRRPWSSAASEAGGGEGWCKGQRWRCKTEGMPRRLFGQ